MLDKIKKTMFDDKPKRHFKNITLETSLKPFREITTENLERVCKKIFLQWKNLTGHADVVSVLLFSSDGSEILDYRGKLDDTFEWASYIGGVNPKHGHNETADPDGTALHTRCYKYMDNPPTFTYGKLKELISIIKKIGGQINGKPINVGTIFDPGPEFAVSDFKYNRHLEICRDNSTWPKCFVCCYATLNKDNVSYAGYPHGIPQDTPFGEFFGRQCNHFMTDLGFDYLWLSNGLGFGTETWGTTGAIFDGKTFEHGKLDRVQENILNFWRLFRKECDIPIQTRGTNLTMGIDLSSDGVPLLDIYRENPDILPPPNSPWAALDGNFGLELAGYMSRMAQLPGDDYIFRFYVHDPWWMNSPWLDRYEGQPHDIFLPLSIARINEDGNIHLPTHLNLLTIDNCAGGTPDQCPNELIPHMEKAFSHFPDAPSPLVWVYPFDEYSKKDDHSAQKLSEMFFGDWYISGAINNGLPLSSVVSTRNFIKNPHKFSGSVLVTIPPKNGTQFEKSIMSYIQNGGRVIFYGPLNNTSQAFRDMLNLSLTDEICGELTISHLPMDGETQTTLNHRPITCAGGVDTILKSENENTKILAEVSAGGESRIAAIYTNVSKCAGSGVAWVRGTCSSDFKRGQHLLEPDNPEHYIIGETLMRHALACFGYNISFVRFCASSRLPVIMISRSNGAFIFSGYCPDTTVGIRLNFPHGAPLLIGSEALLTKDGALYHQPRAWHSECRVFVKQQEDGVIQCRDIFPGSYYMRRRIQVSGLKNATITIFPERDCEGSMELLINPLEHNIVGDKFEGEWTNTPEGPCFIARNITGTALISMPF